MNLELIKQKNEKIKEAIFVSQMQDHKGFEIFIRDLQEVLKNYQFPDVRSLKESDVRYYQGYTQALDDLKDYFSGQKKWAIMPMVDETTGEEEILNKKNK